MKIDFGQFLFQFLIFRITEKNWKLIFWQFSINFEILYITESQIRCLLRKICILGSGF